LLRFIFEYSFSDWIQAGDELTAEELDSVKDVESKFPVRAELNKKIAIW